MSDHTPGPWTVGPHQRIISSGWSIRIADGSAIAYVLGEKNPELQQNARLIRASPNILKALKKAIWMLERDAIDNQKMAVLEECYAAVTQATGDSLCLK